jgi:hypothetical protein
MLRENLAALEEWAGKHTDKFSFIPPKAGGIVFIKYSMKINSSELMVQLRKEKSVFIVAGDLFGMDHYIRIGIGSEKDYLMAGLNLFDDVLRDID